MADPLKILYQVAQSIAPIPDTEWEKLKRIITQKKLIKGQNFATQGERSNEVAFLLEGSVRMFYTDKKGKEFIKAFNFKNDFIASFSSLVLDCPSNHTIQCLEKTSYLSFKWKDFESFSMDHICWQVILRKIIEKEFLEKERREYQLAMLEAKERYQEFLKETPSDFMEKISKKNISSYLGITPSTFSRMKAKI